VLTTLYTRCPWLTAVCVAHIAQSHAGVYSPPYTVVTSANEGIDVVTNQRFGFKFRATGLLDDP